MNLAVRTVTCQYTKWHSAHLLTVIKKTSDVIAADVWFTINNGHW